MNTHESYRELISRLLDEDSTLTAEENADLQAHLAQCLECAAMYNAFSALSGFVGGELEDPPEELRANVMAEIRREEIRRKNRRAFGWTGFVAAAAVLALVIGFAPRLLARESGTALTAQMATGAAAYEESYEEEAQEAPARVYADSAPADAGAYTQENSMAFAAPAEAYSEDDPNVSWEGESPETELSEEEKLSMDALLTRLGGLESDLDLQSLQISPVYLIETDGGVLEIYRYNNSLYYTDPLSGILCEASCSETALIQFLQD